MDTWASGERSICDAQQARRRRSEEVWARDAGLHLAQTHRCIVGPYCTQSAAVPQRHIGEGVLIR